MPSNPNQTDGTEAPSVRAGRFTRFTVFDGEPGGGLPDGGAGGGLPDGGAGGGGSGGGPRGGSGGGPRGGSGGGLGGERTISLREPSTAATAATTASQPIKVVLDASAVPAEPVGVGRYVRGLAGALGSRIDVVLQLVCRRGDAARWVLANPAAGELAKQRGRVLGGPMAVVPVSRPARLVFEQLGMGRVVDRVGADVYHGPHYTLPRGCRVPKVVTVHDLTFFDHPEWHEPWKGVFFRHAIRTATKAADVIICDSHATARRLEVHCRPNGLVSVVHLGVDPVWFSPLEQDAGGDPDSGRDRDGGGDRELLESVGVSGPYVAFVGTIEPRKDVPGLVRAFDRVAGDDPELSLVLAGRNGWGTSEAEDAVSASRHASRIVRLGYVPDRVVRALLRSARVVAYPSLEEGFGLPVLEAMACGSPVITTRGSAMEEVAGEVAWLVSPGDVDDLEQAIRSALAESSDALRSRRKAGIEKASEYTWEAAGRRHVDAYRAALR